MIGFCPKREIRNDSESKIGDTNINDLLKQILIIAETIGDIMSDIADVKSQVLLLITQ